MDMLPWLGVSCRKWCCTVSPAPCSPQRYVVAAVAVIVVVMVVVVAVIAVVVVAVAVLVVVVVVIGQTRLYN